MEWIEIPPGYMIGHNQVSPENLWRIFLFRGKGVGRFPLPSTSTAQLIGTIVGPVHSVRKNARGSHPMGSVAFR